VDSAIFQENPAPMSSTVQNASANYSKYLPRWKKCRDFCAGQDDVMAEKQTYLPKISGQDDDQYKEYLDSGYLYNASGRTRQGLIGMVMRKEPDINVPESMNTIIDDVDQEGTNLKELAEQLVKEEITVARGGLLVDYPNTQTEGMSEAQAEALNLRPYIVHYKAEDIIGDPVFKKIGNVNKMVQLRLQETSDQKGVNEFETETNERVRVLELVGEENEQGEVVRYYYQQRLFQQDTPDGELVEDKSARFVPKINGQRLDEIPFIFVGGHQYREPHIIDLVNANKHHYQLVASHRRGLRWTTRPQITASGQKEEEVSSLTVGGDEIWWSSNENAKWEMLEYTGTGLSGVEKSMEATKEEMATLGARMIAPENKMAETAEAHIIKRQGENSALSTVSKHVSTAMTKALDWCATWMQITEDVSVILNNDFIPVDMSADQVLKWVQAVQSGKILEEDMIYALQKGEVLDPDIAAEDRLSRMQTSIPPGIRELMGARE